MTASDVFVNRHKVIAKVGAQLHEATIIFDLATDHNKIGRAHV